MKQEHFDQICLIFPTSSVEWEGQDIVVDLLLRFSEKEFEAKRIGSSKMVPGFVCIVDPSEDAEEISHHPRFHNVLIDAAGWNARYHASITLGNYDLERFAEELQREEPVSESALAEAYGVPVIRLDNGYHG